MFQVRIGCGWYTFMKERDYGTKNVSRNGIMDYDRNGSYRK